MKDSGIGKIPVDCLDLEMSDRSPHPFDIYVARYDDKAIHNPKAYASISWDLIISWRAGHHIKAYMWRDSEMNTYEDSA